MKLLVISANMRSMPAACLRRGKLATFKAGGHVPVRSVLRGIHHDVAERKASWASSSWKHVACRTTLVRSSSATVVPDLLDRLPVVHDKGHNHLHAVFLLTPSFADLLDENSDFMVDALGRIFPGLSGVKQSVTQCDLMAAVVDRLPGRFISSEQNHKSTEDTGSEGMSVFIASAPTDDGLGLFSDIGSKNLHEPRKPVMSVLFPFRQSDRVTTNIRTLEVPLANTILRTEKAFMMTVSKLSLEPGSSNWIRAHTTERSGMLVSLPQISDDGSEATSLQIPLEPLTAPRRIVDIFGNILRRLQTENDDAMPASKELESSLGVYLRSQESRPRRADVWALILPHVKIRKGPENGLSYRARRGVIPLLGPMDLQKRLSAEQPTPDPQISELIVNGAHLHRVISGGGGWGWKQGLLSLDPENTSSGAWKTSSNDSQWVDDMNSLLGEVATPGDYVQFFVSAPGRSTDGGILPRSRDVISLKFGVTTSDMDNLPFDGMQDQPREGVEAYTVLDGCFGALSGQGMSISMTTPGHSGENVSSKLDMPYASFCITVSPGD